MRDLNAAGPVRPDWHYRIAPLGPPSGGGGVAGALRDAA